MNTTRLRELCDAVENGSAWPEDVKELATLARKAAKTIVLIDATEKAWRVLRQTLPFSHDYADAIKVCGKEIRKYLDT